MGWHPHSGNLVELSNSNTADFVLRNSLLKRNTVRGYMNLSACTVLRLPHAPPLPGWLSTDNCFLTSWQSSSRPVNSPPAVLSVSLSWTSHNLHSLFVLRSILTESVAFHLHLGSGRFPSNLPTKLLCEFLNSPCVVQVPVGSLGEFGALFWRGNLNFILNRSESRSRYRA